MRGKQLTLIGLILILWMAQTILAQDVTGTVCVAARIDDPFVKEPALLSNGQVNSHKLKVKVDKQAAVPWPDRKSLEVATLDRNQSHILAVLGADGKPIESVRFKFSEYASPNLCMTYDGYQGIGLKEATRATPWCRCR